MNSVSFSVSTVSNSRKLESVSLIIPTLGTLAINSLVLSGAFSNFSGVSNMLDVVGIQWYWAIDSSDMVLNSVLGVGSLAAVSTNSLVLLGTGAVSVFILSAADVIHAIAAPNFGVKLDAIPGRVSLQSFSTVVSGNFHGQCSELCGAMHAFMPLGFLSL